MPEAYTLTCDALAGTERVIAFAGSEGLSRPYGFSVWLTVPTADALDLDAGKIVGERATLRLHDNDGAERRAFHGVVSELELVADLPDDVSLYHVRIRPALWKLALSQHSRVWIAKSVPEILEAVLQEAGLGDEDYTLQLLGSYDPREHVSQYHESDLAFLSRWMEREGIYYYFEHGADREKLVLTDDRAIHVPLGEGLVRYFPSGAGDVTAPEALRSFRAERRQSPASTAEKDYDYLKPSLDVAGEGEAAQGEGGEVVEYGENCAKPEEAKRIAKVRAEEILARQVVYRGHGRVFELSPGHLFTLEEHPRPSFLQEYLVTDLAHRGRQVEGAALAAELVGLPPGEAEGYRVELAAIASSVQFRPERRAPWPRVRGVERAVVDGPADDDYAQVDDHGRYLVRIGYDETGSMGGKSSMRVRMLQPHGGSPEGFHFPLRKGTEVLLTFLGGDPDRPAILGVGPNAGTPSPVTKDNRTRNVVETGGESRLEIEDADGDQYVDLSTPPEKTRVHLGKHHGKDDHNWLVSTDGDGLLRTGGNRDITVGGKQTEDVTGNVTEDYHGNQTTHVSGTFEETIDGGAEQTIHAGLTQTIGGSSTVTIDGGETRTIVANATETIGGNHTQTVGGNANETIGGDLQQEITGGAVVTTPATFEVMALGGATLKTPALTTLIAPGGLTVNAPGGEQRVDNFFFHLGADKLATYGLAAEFWETKLELCAVATSLVGLKIEVTAMKMGVTGVGEEKFAAKIELGGPSVESGAASVSNSAVKVVP